MMTACRIRQASVDFHVGSSLHQSPIRYFFTIAVPVNYDYRLLDTGSDAIRSTQSTSLATLAIQHWRPLLRFTAPGN
jgi:hypothetical protein